jgi:hypothetical protein
MRIPEPTNTWPISRAHQVQAVRPVGPVGPGRAPDPLQGATDAIGASPDPAGLRLSRLLAGVVPGGVDFSADGGPAPRADAIPIYRHPAERNSAATGVETGRRLDAQA